MSSKKVCLIKQVECIYAQNCINCLKYETCKNKQGSHVYCHKCKYDKYKTCIKDNKTEI